MGRLRLWLIVASGLGAWLPAGSGVAQTTLDQGTFRLMVSGHEAGRETFSVKRTGDGAETVVIAHGQITLDSAGVRTAVESKIELRGDSLRPTAYESCRTVGARPANASGCSPKAPGDQWTRVTAMGKRFSATMVSAAGEKLREYLVSENAIVADDGFAHHYGFLNPRVSGSARVPIVIPGEGRQVFADVTSAPATLAIAGQSVAVRQFTVVPERGLERRVWIDADGRVLRFEIPARKFVAERTALPK